MSNVMPIEETEFIDELQRWFHESTNMSHEDCYRFAFVIWQHQDKLSQMFGYEQGKADERARITRIIEQELESGYLMEKLINEVHRND